MQPFYHKLNLLAAVICAGTLCVTLHLLSTWWCVMQLSAQLCLRHCNTVLDGSCLKHNDQHLHSLSAGFSGAYRMAVVLHVLVQEVCINSTCHVRLIL